MPSARIRVPIRQHSFMYNSSLESAAADSSEGSSLISGVDDPLFGFLDGGDYSSNNNNYETSLPESSDRGIGDDEAMDLGEEEGAENAEEVRKFWENQHQLLQGTLCRTSSLETGIRNVTKEAVKEIETAGTVCGCGRVMVGGCRSCLMTEIAGRLRNAGYNSGICRTKWRSSPDIPSGEHTFLDVIDNSSSKRGEVRVIIELNFRAEFEMAKASDEYGRLVRRLPEVFVGKIERLANVIKILCTAGKKCMKEKNMHMGPWRKHRYMQAKWLGTCRDRKTPSLMSSSSSSSDLAAAAAGYLGRRKARSSMLTVDLLDMMHCTAVGVM